MPGEDDPMPEIMPPPAEDPPTGLHEESIYALWHDPTTYDPIKHGPPYLPEAKVRMASSAPNAKAVKDFVRPLVQKVAADEMVEIGAVLDHLMSDYGDGVPMRELAALLSFIQAETTIHQSHHWQTRGEPFFGDHLLFERIYNETYAQIDKLAERMVGSGHHVLAHPILLAKHCSLVVQSFYRDAGENSSSDTYPAFSLRATLRTLIALKVVYATLEKKDQLSHGIDNLLQDMADKHESHVYLLKQRVQSKTAYDRRKAPSADRWKAE